MRNGFHLLVTVGIIGCSWWATGCGPKSESFNVTISYVLEPTRQLPEGLTAVAINDAGVMAQGTDEDADRSRKWSKIAADGMEQMIQEAAAKYGSPLTVAKRRDTAKVLQEKDLKLAGIADGAKAAQAAKLLNVQALIMSELNIRVEVKKSRKTTFDVTSVAAAAGYRWGGGGGSMGAREAEAVSRNMTLQCKFSMFDANTSEAIFEYAPKPFRKRDTKKPGVVFGRSAGEADLDPVDMYIGELVEQGTREFVSMFVPCRVEYTYELKSGPGKGSADGILRLRSDDLESAMRLFENAVADKPDDHRSMFALGVTAELMQDWEKALKCYQQVSGMAGLGEEEVNLYLAAKERVKAHKDRIRRTEK